MLIKTIEELDKAQIGDWCFFNNNKDMYLAFPVKSSYEGEPDNKDLVHLPIHRKGEADSRSPSWEFDGNTESPTISPSINVIGLWHGYLRNGKLETA